MVFNLLELLNASFNFYAYCFCQKEIRLHVLNTGYRLKKSFLPRAEVNSGNGVGTTGNPSVPAKVPKFSLKTFQNLQIISYISEGVLNANGCIC